jgi:DNA helicase-2/ATP-dependent DNA helicase PcrA
MRTLPLTESFRWRTSGQQELANALRAGERVTLGHATGGGANVHADVVLASTWNQLWEVDNHVLPLAFHAFKGGLEEAAATVLLNHVTRSVFSACPSTLHVNSVRSLGMRTPRRSLT